MRRYFCFCLSAYLRICIWISKLTSNLLHSANDLLLFDIDSRALYCVCQRCIANFLPSSKCRFFAFFNAYRHTIKLIAINRPNLCDLFQFHQIHLHNTLEILAVSCVCVPLQSVFLSICRSEHTKMQVVCDIIIFFVHKISINLFKFVFVAISPHSTHELSIYVNRKRTQVFDSYFVARNRTNERKKFLCVSTAHHRNSS